MRRPTVGPDKGRMEPTGLTKPCRACGADFPVLARKDCAATRCRSCRPKPLPRGVQKTLRTCEAPGCGILYRPLRGASRFCRACRDFMRGKPR